MGGPLQGLKIVEMVGLGPAPFCAMMLADMGAEVIRIDQKRDPDKPDHFPLDARYDVLARGRCSLAIDLKKPGAAKVVLELIGQADALIEGFRPGVMERLGLGPEACLAANERLVYGRMTGWGQTGPLSATAGHDLNYLALSGVLHAIGAKHEAPTVPLNCIADFGGGAMMLAFGLVCALLESRKSGMGQVIDAAMTEGAALLGAMVYGYKAAGLWRNEREANLLDGGAHFYRTYECADGRYVAVACIEPKFYATLLRLADMEDRQFDGQMDQSRWPELTRRTAAMIKMKARDEWCVLCDGSDACMTPVLDWDEAPRHAHNVARSTFVEVDGVTQPAPVPRFSRTPAAVQRPPAARGEHTDAILRAWGIAPQVVAALRDNQAI